MTETPNVSLLAPRSGRWLVIGGIPPARQFPQLPRNASTHPPPRSLCRGQRLASRRPVSTVHSLYFTEGAQYTLVNGSSKSCVPIRQNEERVRLFSYVARLFVFENGVNRRIRGLFVSSVGRPCQKAWKS
ncbi:hypothetical protein MRX96_007779 [Rhipicephalus microplus]